MVEEEDEEEEGEEEELVRGPSWKGVTYVGFERGVDGQYDVYMNGGPGPEAPGRRPGPEMGGPGGPGAVQDGQKAGPEDPKGPPRR